MKETIDRLWPDVQNGIITEAAKHTSEEVLESLDKGGIRVVEKINGQWQINEWLKKAILIYFKTHTSSLLTISPELKYWDKVPLKFADWDSIKFAEAKFRTIPGAIIRKGAYLASGAVIMPSFINVGVYIGEGTMIDSMATIGSCAQIGKNCHISAGVTLGGVLEPLQARPVIIEDNVFIGAGSQIVEGVIIEENSVVGMGVILGASTKIYDRDSDKYHVGIVPSNSVVVQGMVPSSDGRNMIQGAIIIKKIDLSTKAKTSINELLRD